MKTYPYAVIISRVLSAFRNALMSGHRNSCSISSFKCIKSARRRISGDVNYQSHCVFLLTYERIRHSPLFLLLILLHFSRLTTIHHSPLFLLLILLHFPRLTTIRHSPSVYFPHYYVNWTRRTSYH